MTWLERWRGLHLDPPGNLGWLFVILAIALLAYSIYVYRRTDAPISWGLRSTLMALRAGALILLVVILCRPVLSLAIPGGAARGVLVLVDRSKSMELPARDPGEFREAELERSVRAVKSALGSSYPLFFRGFDQGLGPVLDPQEWPGPEGEGTNIAESLESGAMEGGPEGRPGAMVLITDGTQTQGGDPVPMARRMGIPVQTVGLGSPAAVADLALTRVRANIEAFAGERTPIEAVLRLQGLTESTVQVQLLDVTEEEVEVASATAQLDPGGAEKRVGLSFTPQKTGLRFLEVRVPGLPGEATGANNRRLVALQVREEKTGVLFLSGSLTWDHTFIRRALETDSTLTVTSGVWREGSFRKVARSKALPTLNADGLRSVRVIVLDHVSPAQLGGTGVETLAGFVRRGGGLLVITGSEDGALTQWTGSALESALPIQAGGGVRESETQVRLTAAGRRHALFDPSVPGAAPPSIWNELPPIRITRDAGPVRGTGEALLESAEAGGNRPLLAWSRSGQGRVLMVAGGGVWRWDFTSAAHGPQGNVLPGWWRRSAHWLSLPSLETRLDIHPEEYVVSRGESITFVGRATNERFEPLSGVEIEVTLTPPAASDREETTLKLGGSDGFYSGVVGSLPPGRYRYQGRARTGDGVLGVVEGVVAVDSLGTEMERLEADHEILERIASVSGGRFWSPDSLGGLAQTFGALAEGEEERVQLALWDHPLIFVLFVLFASTEWFLRRRRGLI